MLHHILASKLCLLSTSKLARRNGQIVEAAARCPITLQSFSWHGVQLCPALLVPRKQISAFVHQPYHTLPGNRRLVPYLHSGSGYAAHDSHLEVRGENARQRDTEGRTDQGSGIRGSKPPSTHHTKKSFVLLFLSCWMQDSSLTRGVVVAAGARSSGWDGTGHPIPSHSLILETLHPVCHEKERSTRSITSLDPGPFRFVF